MWYHFHLVLFDEDQAHFGRVKSSIVSTCDQFSNGRPDFADKPICKRLQNTKDLVVRAESAALRQDLDGVKTRRLQTMVVIIFVDCRICRSRSRTFSPWVNQMISWSIVKQNRDSSNVAILRHDLAAWMRSTYGKTQEIDTVVSF
jgi:hypothetical protein